MQRANGATLQTNRHYFGDNARNEVLSLFYPAEMSLLSRRDRRRTSALLDRRILAGAATYAYANRAASFIISFGSLAVMARLLTPHDFGLVAMITTFTGLLTSLRDSGLSSAAIQSKDLSLADRNALFWYNAGLSVLASTLVLLAAPLVSHFYHEDDLKPLLYLSSFGLLASGIGTIHAAILRRDFNLKGVFFAEIGGLAVGAIVSMLLAYFTRSALSVVIGGILQAIATSAIAILFGRWVPKIDTTSRLGFQYLLFGFRVSAYAILNFITNNIGSVAVGYQSGSTAMGAFNRAQTLYGMPVSFVLNPYLQVQFPLLCRVRGDVDHTRQIYGDLLVLTSTLFVPLAVLLPFLAVAATTLVLGNQWTAAGQILAWLSPSLAALGLIGPFGQFMMSQGRVKELQWWGFADVGLRGGGALIGSFFSPTAAAAGFSFATLLIAAPIMVWITQRDGTFCFKDYARACFPGIFIASMVGLTALAVSRFASGNSFGPFAEALMVLSASLVPWVALAAAVHLSPIKLYFLPGYQKDKDSFEH
ncbi:lipopolysaccharide biosynthesis protein [Bradyrhizobium sp. NBAIM08]|uniref:lipopolysaccharide biosynthesis protein n=1 Tax=Bradyrhizobium sp. NBAIM08 TaxID=2793815 RepID=UPI001CD5000B|nr:lipopolysaccharide biosynthesis protein [Bradyrhizobium sp. NBAIM08]MCA1476120.1 lipopolysaccharide biosynthesis protein [Bradyrhizobium sp. NBAIM08]